MEEVRHSIFIENYELNGIELGWRNFIRPKCLLQSGLRHETVLPSSKTKQANINNIPHRGSHAFGFLELRRALGGEWQNWMAGRISGGPSDFGFRAEISYGHQFFLLSYGSGAEIEVFSTFGDEEQIDSYFGVSQSDANASSMLLTYFDGGYRSSGINATYPNALNRNIQTTVKGRVELYSREIENSSLVKDAFDVSINTSIAYRFN